MNILHLFRLKYFPWRKSFADINKTWQKKDTVSNNFKINNKQQQQQKLIDFKERKIRGNIIPYFPVNHIFTHTTLRKNCRSGALDTVEENLLFIPYGHLDSQQCLFPTKTVCVNKDQSWAEYANAFKQKNICDPGSNLYINWS